MFSSEVLEKITLISLIGIIFAQIVPNIEATPIQITVGVAVLVALDTLVSLWAVRRGEAQLRWTFRAFFELIVLNAGLMIVFSLVLRDGGSLDPWNLLFFSYLLTLIIVLYDRYRSVYEARFAGETGKPPGLRLVVADAWRHA